MPSIPRRPGLALAAGLAVVLLAATARAGLDGSPIPASSWLVWAVAFAVAIAVLRAAGIVPGQALRRLAWPLPFIVLLVLPAALLVPPERRAAVALGLAARALAATSVGTALAAWLGPTGLVEGARELRLPARLVQVLAAALASLTLVIRQTQAMLRAREARRPGYGASALFLASPRETARGFGRLVAALLLRTLERAEALDRARRARGVGDS